MKLERLCGIPNDLSESEWQLAIGLHQTGFVKVDVNLGNKPFMCQDLLYRNQVQKLPMYNFK